MTDRFIRLAIVTASGLLLWEVASFGLGRAEPWDAPGFWYAYLAAIGLAALWGYVFPAGARAWGFVLMFTLMPVMWLNSGEVGSMWLLGLILLAIMALPAAGAAMLASRYGLRRA